jgi:hypothetical protein
VNLAEISGFGIWTKVAIMSISIYIACGKCRKKHWIGQSSLEMGFVRGKLKTWWDSYLYTDEPKTMKALNRFLKKHLFHNVFLATNGDGDERLEFASTKD